jgi:hypothetical protein
MSLGIKHQQLDAWRIKPGSQESLQFAKNLLSEELVDCALPGLFAGN